MRRLIIVPLLVLSACTSAPMKQSQPESPTPPAASPPVQNRCVDCGVVQDIRKVSSKNDSATATGPVLSGVVGNVLSKPTTDKPSLHYEIVIQLLSGKKVTVKQTTLSAGLKVGSKVRVSQGRILAVAP